MPSAGLQIKNRCFCNAAMITPINISGHILGTISLLSFDEEQRRQLLTRQGQYLDFIARMGELLAGQVQLHDALTQVANNERQLKTIIDSVSEGIIAVNAAGQISYLNRYAEQLLNVGGDFLIGKSITRYFPDSPLPEVITKQSAVIEKEVCFHKNNIRLNFISSAYPVIAGEKVIGAVKTFKDIKQASRLAGRLINRHETIYFDDIKGNSPALGNLIERAKVVAAGKSTVLLRGESGTGKDLFARAIYQASPFRNGPFQVINCSAIPESLLESELFGYEEGAFTGARKGGKPGKFELADGGTLFLDEIGDMPLTLQAKLLRVLESNKLERVGGTENANLMSGLLPLPTATWSHW